MVTRAHRLRLQVNSSEAAQLEDFARTRQKAWNWALAILGEIWGLDRSADRLRALDQKGQPYRHVDKFTLIRLFTQEKESLGWSAGVPSRVTEYAFEDLMAAVSEFLKNRVPGSRKVGFPHFIPVREAVTFTVRGVVSLTPDRPKHKGTISIPLLPPLRVCGSTSHLMGQMARLDGRIKEVTVSRVSGRWYASVLLERQAQGDLVDPATITPEDTLGMDVGLTTYATFSDGSTVANPRFGTSPAAKRHERHRSRGVGRKQAVRDLVFNKTGVMPPKSNRQLNSEQDLARHHSKNRDRRSTFAAQCAANVFPEIKVLGAETLSIANMVKNHALARSISGAGWSGHIKALESRAEDQGCLVVRHDRFFASTQLCSNCGHKNEALKGIKNLKTRSWTCPACGTLQLRDPNAATNLKPTAAQIATAYQTQLERISKYEKTKQKRAENAAKSARTKANNAAARKERSACRAAAKASAPVVQATPSQPLPPHPSPTMPVLGSRTSVYQIPGETQNRAWRVEKSVLRQHHSHPGTLPEESRTAPAEGHYVSTAPPP
jgi:hypothetical protein